MSEVFVKTLKRDYAGIIVLPDAATILALLPDWIEDLRDPPALRPEVPLPS